MGRNLKINRDFVLFAVGAIIGSAATWLYLKDEYDRRLKEDVDSVKESFGRLYKKEEKPEEEKPYTPYRARPTGSPRSKPRQKTTLQL